MPDGEEDDVELLRLTAAGDEEAFGVLVARHQAAVWRFVRSLVRDESRAEDALQETFLAVWKGAAGFRGDAGARTWIFTIARNALNRQFRGAAANADEVPLGELGAEAGWGDGRAADDVMARADLRMLFERAIEALPAADREILMLRDVEGFSGEETASLLGLTLPAMKTRLHRARLRFAAEARRRTGDA